MKQELVVVIGAGGIGMAIARRQGFGSHILLADFNIDFRTRHGLRVYHILLVLREIWGTRDPRLVQN
jgi:phosphoglycerate dehydrogenase-like enzyme